MDPSFLSTQILYSLAQFLSSEIHEVWKKFAVYK